MELLNLISDPSFIVWSGIASLFIIMLPLIWNRISNHRMRKAIFDIQKDVKEIKLMLSVPKQQAYKTPDAQNLANTSDSQRAQI